MNSELIYWIWLSLRCGAGSELGSYLLKHFPSPRAIFEATEEELRAVDGVDNAILALLLDRDLALPTRIVEYCERVNVGIMTLDSAIYPERLRAIHAKPLVLYYRGKVPLIDDHVLIACVGTRSCSEKGKALSYKLGKELVQAGAIVVSGMARGIDSAAQEGALDAGGHTIAVLGCGIDRVYPPENKDLMRRIAENGTLITEFAPGTEPAGKNFPIRNRIIAGLCKGTVVVEADQISGALITARHAITQGRDLYAFPGGADEPLSAGPNMLIKEGAKLVTSAYDILSEYELLYPHRIFTEKISLARTKAYRRGYSKQEEKKLTEPPTQREDPPAFHRPEALRKSRKAEKETPKPRHQKDISHLGDVEQKLLLLMGDMICAEELTRLMKENHGISLEMGELLGTLTMLEIDGLCEALPGGSFRALLEE